MFTNLFRRKSAPQLHSKTNKKIVVARLPSRIFPDTRKVITVEETFGLIRLIVHEATLDSASRGRSYFATISIGKQTLVSKDAKSKSDYNSVLPFESGAEFVLQKDGPTVARVAVFKQGRLDGALSNRLECWAEVDLAHYFNTANGNGGGDRGDDNVIEGWFDLLDPADAHNVHGRIRISAEVSSLHDLQRQIWEKLLPLADFNGDGILQENELKILLKAFGSEVEDAELDELFQHGTKGKGSTDGIGVEELSRLLAFGVGEGRFSRFIKRCPVDGAELDPNDDVSNLIYVALALNEGAGLSVMKGGYLTEAQASRSWMLRISEWATQPLAGVPITALVRLKDNDMAGGLKTGAAAAHILVYDRSTKMMVEERLSPVLTLALRNLYQSQVGRALMKQGLHKRLVAMSVREGEKRDAPESVKDIKPFLDSYRGQINVDEMAAPLDSFKSFNEFFYRKLKPEARPIAFPNDPLVITSAADCRLQVYSNVDEATRFWIKGTNFSIAGLLHVPGSYEASSVATSEASDAEDGGDTTNTDNNNKKDAKNGSGLNHSESTSSMKSAKSYCDGVDASAFYGGCLAIFRLAPQDYHRFHSPVGGTVLSIRDVPGGLLTVNPIAVNSAFCDVFTQNKRSVMVIQTEAYGPVAFIAIGATLVGSIEWTVTTGQVIAKGAELGYFAFGGSTCIVLFPDGCVTWDADLAANSRKSLESLVKVGERIGVKAGSTMESSPTEAKAIILRTESIAEEHGVVPLNERIERKVLLSREDEVLKSVLDVEEAVCLWTLEEKNEKEEQG